MEVAKWIWDKQMAKSRIFEDGFYDIGIFLDNAVRLRYPETSLDFLEELRTLMYGIGQQAEESQLYFNRNKEKSVL